MECRQGRKLKQGRKSGKGMLAGLGDGEEVNVEDWGKRWEVYEEW